VPLVLASWHKPKVRNQCRHQRVNFHPFAGTLREWEDGVPVDCGKSWTWEAITAAVEKGARKSATSDESIALIAEYVAYQVAAGYAQIVTWEELCAT
jgi:hypothetical protein